MKLKPIIDLLEAANLGVFGTDLFISRMPYETQAGILVRDKLMGAQIDDNLPGYFKTTFQVIVRNSEYEAGYDRMDDVMEALRVVLDLTTPLYEIKRLRPLHKPICYPVSEGNLVEFSVNFEIVFVE